MYKVLLILSSPSISTEDSQSGTADENSTTRLRVRLREADRLLILSLTPEMLNATIRTIMVVDKDDKTREEQFRGREDSETLKSSILTLDTSIALFRAVCCCPCPCPYAETDSIDNLLADFQLSWRATRLKR